jgi:hypothetical protein
MRLKDSEIFSVGQPVVLVDSGFPLAVLRKLREEVSEGPFEIVEVQPIPAGLCSCGIAVDDPGHVHYFFCSGATGRQEAGHHQKLSIKDQKGRIIHDPKGLPRFFSGALFRVIK